MRTKLFILGCITLAMASCGSPEPKTTTTTETTPTTTETPAKDTVAAVAPAPAVELPGEKLIAKSDCMACHNKETKIVGPAYVNIATKYENNEENIAMLSEKVIKGGTGVWGSVPMTPHPTISSADAKEMVKYILSLKK